MDFNIEDFKAIVEKTNKPSVMIFCSSSTRDCLEKHWVEEKIKAQFYTSPYDDDRIFVIPVEEMERPIKLVIPEEQERLKRYLGMGSEE